MPSWNEISNEIKASPGQFDAIRRSYLYKLNEYTRRNTIIYYSGWLQKPNANLPVSINDSDKNGFMAAIKGLDKSLGLDLVLHTPGGDIAATESIIDYLRSIFGPNIRTIVPQLAMSAGTMIACASKTIIMGKHSSLGPFDPQLGPGLPAHGVIEEFEQARKEIKADPSCIPLWQPIISKYPPAFIGECDKAMKWSKEIAQEILANGMFNNESDAQPKIDAIITELTDHALTKSHSRHLSIGDCIEMGLKIDCLEEDETLQDLVLSLHHACIHTLGSTLAYKIIENQNGTAYISSMQPIQKPLQI